MLCYIVLCNSWYKINDLLRAIAKAKTTSLLIDLIKKNYLDSENKSLYRDNTDKKNPASIDNVVKIPKKILVSINKDKIMLDIKLIISKNKHNTFIWSRSEI